MTRDDIIRMARAAWGDTDPSVDSPAWYQNLERFAALVAAAVYENDDMFTEAYAGGFSAGAAAEREACAQVCDRFVTLTHQHEEQIGPGSCAAAIRARGEK